MSVIHIVHIDRNILLGGRPIKGYGNVHYRTRWSTALTFSKFSLAFDGRNRKTGGLRSRPGRTVVARGHFNPNEPRVPAGQREGGQWTRARSIETSGWWRGPWTQLASADEPRRGQRLIQIYRRRKAVRDLFGRRPEPNSSVAMTTLDGKHIFGASSKHPSYTNNQYHRALNMRDKLIEKYPKTMMRAAKVGQFPNATVFHAEATVLMNAAKENGGTLAGRTLVVEVDRKICPSCELVLPLIVREIGSPTVTFIDKAGTMYRASHGQLTMSKLRSEP